MKEKCPFCGSKDTQQWMDTTYQKVGWGDGLGSPGMIDHNEEKARCLKCNREWKPVDKEKR